jgi:hypothetical protein
MGTNGCTANDRRLKALGFLQVLFGADRPIGASAVECMGRQSAAEHKNAARSIHRLTRQATARKVRRAQQWARKCNEECERGHHTQHTESRRTRGDALTDGRGVREQRLGKLSLGFCAITRLYMEKTPDCVITELSVPGVMTREM